MRVLIASLLLIMTNVVLAAVGNQANPFGTGEPEFLPVAEAYQLEIELGDDGSLRLYWQIADGYYLYQHRFAFAMEDQAGAVALDVELPPALQRTDEYFGEVRVYYNNADVLLQPARLPGRATLSVSSQGCADAGLCYPPQKQYFELDFTTGSAAATGPPAKKSDNPAPAGDATGVGNLFYMLMLAFFGGSILNLMPCVFPILSLKVLGFTRSTAHDRHLHSWVYAGGVVVSFVLVAAALIGLQQAGQAIGWGFQLQSPGFVIALAYLFVAMGLSLSGVVDLGSNIMDTGSGLADREGLTGSFFTGVLAVVVASPCTAPFMGTALGFAISQPPQVALLVFAALGAGMAAPLLLLSYSGAARRLLPKPGAWMDTLKQLLAFPLYGTAIWLLWVAGRQTGVNTMATALAGALALTLGLWLWRYGGWRKALALGCILGAASLGSLRSLDEDGSRSVQLAAGKVAWSAQALVELRRAGNPVFVDVTADWCITCLANESAVLLTEEMTAAFAAHGVVYMVADWTNYDSAIAGFLRSHNRSGIPLYLMYPADTSLDPVMLPQLLTKSTVLAALSSVASPQSTVAADFQGNPGVNPGF